MPRVNHQIAHLIHVDAAKAKKQILDALREEGMHMANAAARIGCTHGTLLVWVKKLDMQADIDALRDVAKRNGWHHDHVGGRPRGPGKVARERAEKRAARLAAEKRAGNAKKRPRAA
jgi:transposase-like protein